MENVIENYLDSLSFISEGEELLGEGFSDIMKKLDPRKLKSLIPNIESAYKNKDSNKLMKVAKSISSKEENIDKIEKLAKNNIPNFKSTFSLSFKVLKNTFPEASVKIIKALAISVAAKSGKSDNPIGETKKLLKQIAFKINSDLDKKENDEDKIQKPKGVLIDEVIGWIVIGLLISAITVATGLA